VSCAHHARERAWKLKQAKRFVRAVKSSRMDVESRAEVRALGCRCCRLLPAAGVLACGGFGVHRLRLGRHHGGLQSAS
jgi:hypothetical protein